MTLEDFERHEELAAPGVDRKGLEKPRHRRAETGMMDERADVRLAAGIENPRRQRDQVRGHAAGVAFEIGERRHRIVVEIEPARRDQRIEPLHRQLVARNGRAQRRRHRMRPDLAAALAVEHIAPPLQPDLAGQRIANDLAHARDLQVEGIERKQRAAMLGRRKQRGEKAVPVRRAHQRLAMGVLHGGKLTAFSGERLPRI